MILSSFALTPASRDKGSTFKIKLMSLTYKFKQNHYANPIAILTCDV
jgi:hypothetical protein